MATYSKYSYRKSCGQRSLGGATVHGVGHNLVTKTTTDSKSQILQMFVFNLPGGFVFMFTECQFSSRVYFSKYVLSTYYTQGLGKSLRIQLQVLTGI